MLPYWSGRYYHVMLRWRLINVRIFTLNKVSMINICVGGTVGVPGCIVLISNVES